MVGPVPDGTVARCRDTLLSMAIAKAASLHDEVIYGKVLGGRSLVQVAGIFGLAGTGLVLQQTHADVGHPQLLLARHPERV